VTGQFTGSQVGDVVLGGKINLLTEANLSPVAVAVRGLVKLPTGDTDAGTSTGRTDGAIDLIVSKDFGALELSAFSGFMVRGSPDNVELPNGVRWGVGTGIPLGRAVTLFGEVKSETLLDDQLTLMGPLLGSDGTHSALSTPVKSPVDMTVGLQWNAPRGFYVGAGLNYAAVHDDRVTAGRVSKWGDRLGLLFRLGYHPGVKAYAPPPPPPPPPPPAPDNRPPTVTLSCDPCELLFGEESRLRADANDPDGDPLEYRWSAPTGEFQDPPNREVRRWRAPNQEGPVPITVTVSDGRGGSASDTVTVIVNAPPLPPAREYVFEDVHFDFDRYTLRVGAARVLDEVVAAMEADPNLRIEIEGHTCNIGTAEYNLALGERRANSVEAYLTSRNIGANRLQTVSYGEERPQHDNTREETRRLNRRAALVVRVVQ
jgi:outer membrane protein OmpA-like peptidoglycan-associated protein